MELDSLTPSDFLRSVFIFQGRVWALKKHSLHLIFHNFVLENAVWGKAVWILIISVQSRMWSPGAGRAFSRTGGTAADSAAGGVELALSPAAPSDSPHRVPQTPSARPRAWAWGTPFSWYLNPAYALKTSHPHFSNSFTLHSSQHVSGKHPATSGFYELCLRGCFSWIRIS